MDLDLVTILVIGGVFLVVNTIVFYLIIRAAVSNGSETAKRLKHAWAQTELLLAMARKQGVDDSALLTIAKGLNL